MAACPEGFELAFFMFDWMPYHILPQDPTPRRHNTDATHSLDSDSYSVAAHD